MPNARDEAIKKMYRHAMEGNYDALHDLVTILGPSDNSQEILSRIFMSSMCTEDQRKLILSKKHLFSRNTLESEIRASASQQRKNTAKENMIAAARNGNIQALMDMIDLLRGASFESIAEDDLPFGHYVVWADQRLSDVLEEIFLSSSSTPEQKKLIWKHRGIKVKVVYLKELKIIRDVPDAYIDENGKTVIYARHDEERIEVSSGIHSFHDCVRDKLLQKSNP